MLQRLRQHRNKVKKTQHSGRACWCHWHCPLIIPCAHTTPFPRNASAQWSYQELEWFYFQNSYKERYTRGIWTHLTSAGLCPWLHCHEETASASRCQFCWVSFNSGVFIVEAKVLVISGLFLYSTWKNVFINYWIFFPDIIALLYFSVFSLPFENMLGRLKFNSSLTRPNT